MHPCKNKHWQIKIYGDGKKLEFQIIIIINQNR